ncbi:hypothetical protein RHMOL_Rhmol08G0225600 [Rhododendron molle]|uniref:Uncharacterized protein n=1 Tax=Rhododendron molle TaxID=49168 RepID=A0ACC0MR40_RHOML|nr:hypothetical protein RHMOL_Rhmol08G0225600 [Rhododendron molle]
MQEHKFRQYHKNEKFNFVFRRFVSVFYRQLHPNRATLDITSRLFTYNISDKFFACKVTSTTRVRKALSTLVKTRMEAHA